MSNSEKTVISSTVLLEPRKETENKHLYEPSKVSYLQDQVPQEIVIKIFSYFDIKELVKLAAVCRSWRDLIHGTPRFWWKAYLTLPCWRQRKLRKNVYSYAALYGNRCRDLIISCEHRYVNVACCEKLAIYLRNLLHLLHPTTLTSFKINDARLVCGKPSVRSSVIKILIGMLSRFDRLQCFAMPFAKFFYTEGIKVLKTVTSASKETLQSLLIEGFFHTPNEIIMEEPVSFDDVTKGILSLNNLKKLGIDFFVLTDDFVNALCTSSAKLEKLKINSSYITFSTKNISQISWLNLTKAFPKMKVEISVTSIVEFPTISIPIVLEPVLPISKIRLDIRKNYHPNDEPNIGAVLRHISTHFSRSLVKFEMDIDNRDDPIDEVLEIFVQSCPHLLHLTVSAHFASPHTQQHVLDLIQARRLQQCKYPRKPRSQIREPPQTKAFPKMKIRISVDITVEAPTISIPLLLEPVLPINKIRLDIDYLYYRHAEPKIGAVLQHISNHFSRSLVKFEMDIDNRDDPIDEVLKIFVQSCPRLLHLTVLAHFVSPHTQQHILDLIQARRLEQRQCPLKPRS